MPFLPRPEKKMISNWSSMERKKFYSTTAWRNIRQLQIAAFPYCEICFSKGKLVDCTQGGIVDHIVRIEAGGAPLDLRNLWTLCPTCNARKTALDSHSFEIDMIGIDGAKVPSLKAKQDIIKKLI